MIHLIGLIGMINIIVIPDSFDLITSLNIVIILIKIKLAIFRERTYSN